MKTRLLLLLVALVGLAGLAAPTASAQITTAAMSGRIVDQNAEELAGATVVALHVPSGSRYGGITREDGRYNLTGLRVGGPYTVTVTYIGYRTEVREGLQLSLGQNFTLDVTLREEGVEGEEFVVESREGAVISRDRTGSATNISQEQLETLPTVSRSLADFTRLTPQASSTGFNNTIAGRNNLYNNITVDGSVLNNVFGLAGEVGGQTNAQPISLDAIEQIQVNIAPYDVRQGSFTGAGINVVTKSGTNRLEGSAYTFTRSESTVGDKIAGADVANPNFSQNRYGLSLGGPLVRNKAFLFANAELGRRDDPGQFFRPRLASDTTPLPADVSTVNQTDLEQLKAALQTKYGFDPGTFGPFTLDTYSDNVTARFDLNLSNAHRFSLRYNYLNSYRDVPLSNSGATGGRQNNASRVPFSGSNYRINNDVQSFIGQLNSTFGTRFSNTARLGFTALRDSRSAFIDTPFPTVDIENGNGSTFTTFGAEPFTPNNKLDTDIFQFSNDFSAYLGAHTVTLGTSNEFYSFSNGFTPNYYGYFRFRSLADFIAHINAPDPTAANVPQPSRYQLQYSAVAGTPVPLAEISAAQLGFYVQDEWTALPNLRLTGGLRVDVPVFTSDLPTNATVAGLTFRGGEKIDVSRLPDATPLWSPRLGFNYDVTGDRRYQVRGGTGVFTGKIPFVWVSNQASNNGVLFGETVVQAASGSASTTRLCQPGTGVTVGGVAVACQPITFSNDVAKYVPANPTLPASVLINATAENFKFPQVWRTNLATDLTLPGGVIATLEALYSKDLNAVFHRNANLPTAGAEGGVAQTFTGPDQRPRFGGSATGVSSSVATNYTRVNDGVTSAIVLDNTSKGFQQFVTAQLQKSFDRGLFDGLFASLAYTNSLAKDLTSSTSAIAATAFNNNQIVGDPNDPTLSYSNYMQRHRFVGVGGYNLRYLGLAGTSLSLVYTGGSGFRYSYTYAGDMNGDGISGNDLIYVPTDATDAAQIAINRATGETRSETEIRQQIEAFIAQDDYLSSRRGQYAERNGAEAPWTNRFDVGIKQQFYVPVGARRTKLELSLDIQNVGNLINSDWGVVRTLNSGVSQFLTARGVNATATATTQAGQPTFTMPLQGGNVLTETFRNDVDLSSRWQAQFGFRVSF